MPLRHLATALLFAAGPLVGGDAVLVRDVRLGFGTLSGGVSTQGDFHSSAVDAGADVNSPAGSHTRLALGFVGACAEPGLGGLLVGLGLARDTAENTLYNQAWGEDISKTWTGYLIESQVGWAYAFEPRFHVEAAALIGIGTGTVELHDVSGYSFDPGQAWVYEYGLRVGGYATIRQAQVGLEFGYMFTRYQNAIWEQTGNPNVTYAEDTLFSGLFLGLTLGYRL